MSEEKSAVRRDIYMKLMDMRDKLELERDALEAPPVNLRLYESLVRKELLDGVEISIWSDAIDRAIAEHQVLYIPGGEPYYIDRSIILPSNRAIYCDDNTIIRLKKGVRTLMLRNEHTADGTHEPFSDEIKAMSDCNITICGGRFEEMLEKRAGYGTSGLYDEQRSFYGVSTAMLFNNMRGLTLRDITFSHTGGFAVQMGNISEVCAENISFESCFADGLHINGNSNSLFISNISGEVGDDLVALNMYDWQNSSVNFGPTSNILCENLTLAPSSRYKALRILPGIYYYRDGSSIDCSLSNAIIRNVSGINTFKLYYQTPRYKISGGTPENGGVGSGDNIFFENISIDLDAPIDALNSYVSSDPVRGAFAAFELGANIGTLYFDNIALKLHRDIYPLSYFISAGPKSIQYGECEIFDPYISCKVGRIVLHNIKINGEKFSDAAPYIRETAFDSLYANSPSTGSGRIEQIIIEQD